MPSIGVLTVVHPGVVSFWSTFMDGCRHQTDSDWTLYLVDETGEADRRDRPRSCRIVPAPGGILANRAAGLEAMRADGCDTVVFADADDVMLPERIAMTRELVARHPSGLVANLASFTDDWQTPDHPLFTEPPADGQTITADDLLLGNPVGLTNTAMPVAGAQACLQRLSSANVTALDWAMAVCWCQAGHAFHYEPAVCAAYRRHETSIGVTDAASVDATRRILQVRMQHHGCFAGDDASHQRCLAACRTLLDYDDLSPLPPSAHGWWWEVDVLAELARQGAVS